MSLSIGALELKPGYDTIGVRSNFSGSDPHRAILEYRRSGASWIPGIDMENDVRATVAGSSGAVNNPYKDQNRAVVFFVEPRVTYDVRVTYYSPDGQTTIGQHQGTVTILDDDPLSNGNDYYVTETGNDSSNGSQGNPWRTVKHAASAMQAGDTAWISGSHNEGQVLISRSGQINNYITFRGLDSNNKPVITGNARGVFQADGRSYIKFKDLDIRNTNSSDGQGIAVYGACRGLIIEDCLLTTRGNGWWVNGVCLRGNPSDILIQGNIFTTQTSGNDGPYGILLYGQNGGCRAITMRDNEFLGGYNDAIGSAENFIMAGGFFEDCHAHHNLIDGANDDAFEPEGACVNSSIWGNHAVNFGIFGIGLCNINVGPFYIFRNVWDCPDNQNGCFKTGAYSDAVVNVYHNTVKVSNAVVANYHDPRNYSNMKFRNNIMWGQGNNYYVIEDYNPDANENSYDYNLMYSTRNDCIKWQGNAKSWQNWRSQTGQEPHGKFGNPSFVNQQGGDYRLQSNSPAIDAGVVIKGFNDSNSPWPYGGNAPDIGAIESGVTGPPDARFSVNTDEGEAPLTVQFINETVGAVTSYLWQFGDGQTSTQENPIHVYQDAGTYQVELQVTGPGGSDSAYMTITALEVHYLTLIAGLGGTTNPAPGTHQLEGYVQIRAIPDTDYRFDRWMENGSQLSTLPTIMIQMNTDRTITAEFEYVPPPPVYTLTLIAGTGGTTDPAPGMHELQGEIELTALPDADYRFSRWMENGVELDDINPITINLTEDRTITAEFEYVPPPPVPVLTLEAGPGGSTDPVPGSYEHEGPIQLTAIPDTDYVFDRWEQNGNYLSNENPVDVNIEADITITAIFEYVEPPVIGVLTLHTTQGGTTNPPPGTYPVEGTIQVTAIPEENYTFRRWEEDGALLATINPITLNMARDRDITAVFEYTPPPPIPVLILNTTQGGTTDPPPGTYEIEGNIELTALPDSDYRFARWEENGGLLSVLNPVVIAMDTDRTITAVFEYVEPPPGEYIVTINTLGEGYTSPDGEVSVEEGETLPVAAFPAPGWKFSHWEGDITGTQNPINFPVMTNMSVVAVFTKEETPTTPILGGIAVAALIGILATRKR